jgi:hypothetical protein
MSDTKQQLQADWAGDRIASEDRAKQLGHSPGHRVDFEEGVRSFVERRPPHFAPWIRVPGAGFNTVESDY